MTSWLPPQQSSERTWQEMLPALHEQNVRHAKLTNDAHRYRRRLDDWAGSWRRIFRQWDDRGENHGGFD